MPRRFQFLAVSLASVVALSGCVQATRHSNTMIFGTNTSFGIKVGTSPAQVPSINVGYDRQEAVIMPLVANTREREASKNALSPCNVEGDVSVGEGGKYAVHPCSLVAVRGKAMDSYSVLASFGANFDGSANSGGTAGVKGGLAQYFATGMAAQILALNGGASVVAVGEAAKASASNPPEPESVKALFSDDSAYKVGVAKGQSYRTWTDNLLAKVHLTPVDQIQNKIKAFEQQSKSTTSIAAACTEIEQCKAVISSGAYLFAYRQNPSDFDTALAAW